MKYLLIKEIEWFLHHFPCAADSVLQLQAKEPFLRVLLKAELVVTSFNTPSTQLFVMHLFLERSL